MDSRHNELKVGIALLLSIVILIGGIMWGKGFSLRVARYHIEVVFDNVGGLEPGSNVLANGVVKGRVHDVVLRSGKVYVHASLDNSVSLYSDYHITIESPTVMAGKVLSIVPGSTLPLADVTRTLKGVSPLGMSEAVTMFQDLSADLRTALHSINALAVNLNLIVGDSANRENVSQLLASASGAAQTTEEWLKDNRGDLTATLDRLESTVVSAQHLIGTMDSRFDSTMTGVDSTVAQINALTLSLRDLVDKIKAEDGTVGKLLKDDEIYLRLNRTLAEVDSLAHTIRTKGLRNRIVLF